MYAVWLPWADVSAELKTFLVKKGGITAAMLEADGAGIDS